MTDSFGSQTVTFITKAQSGSPGRLGVKALQDGRVDVPGCRHRPLSATEQAEQMTNVSTQVWKTTAPPVPAAMNAVATGQLEVDGQVFDIIGGAKPFEDYTGPFKVTILSQVHHG